MQVRAATENDIPQILHLLYLSRGKQSIPKTEEYWNWKHLKNPFGISPFFLAEEHDQIVGVRTMMHWQWQKGDNKLRTLRAVDTATHPEHQGKGIFTKLTMAMVEYAKKEGIDFIFNTPNEKSRSGYLKMGWQNVGRVRVGFKLLSNFNISKNDQLQYSSPSVDLAQLTLSHNNFHSRSDLYFTPKSEAYLKWRYIDNPVIKYSIFQDEGVFLAVYLKEGRIKELRIAECMSDFSISSISLINSFIRQKARENRAKFITCSPETIRKLGGIRFNLPVGPKLTVRGINHNPFFNPGDYFAAIGDLELF